MKYKVGDKVRVRRDLNMVDIYDGVSANSEMMEKEIVTIASVNRCHYKIEEDSFCWTEKMFEGLVEEELTAEEAIKIQAEMCRNMSDCANCPIHKEKDGYTCEFFKAKNSERVVEILKQWKKEHEKKPIETENVMYIVVMDEKRNVVYEEKTNEAIITATMKEKVLKKYCEEHDGKYYAISERRCVVKE